MSDLDDNLRKVFGDHAIPELDRLKDRHPSSVHMLKVLAPNPNLTGELANVANKAFGFGYNMFHFLTDGPELTAGLRKLVEAKDCFIRAALDADPVDYRDR